MTKETAMKILKELHSKSLFAERTALETLIPELTESEGEKIRKRVLFSLQKDFMATKNSGCSTKDLEDCIAWLEKQGSSSIKWQKNTPHNKPAIKHSVLMRTTQGIAEGEWQGEDWFQYRWSWTLKDSDVLAWMELSDLDEQGEQKPIVDFKAKDWYVSKVDGKIHDMTYNPTDKVVIKKGEKPATWSDEDESCINNAIAACRSLYGEYSETAHWLKSLKDRVQRKEE